MGNVSPHDPLALRWAEILADPVLRDLPYKIELSARGKIEMSPAGLRHGRLQALIAAELARQLAGGVVITECPVLTSLGIRVPDVVWASLDFYTAHADAKSFPSAPDLCVGIVSRSNSDEEMREKVAAYLAAGAKEVWLVYEAGGVKYFDAAGAREASAFGVTLSLPPSAAV
jgi:Uma2 family endonuclease